MGLGIPSYNQIKDSLTRKAFQYLDLILDPAANIVTGLPSTWPAVNGLEVITPLTWTDSIGVARKVYWGFKYNLADAKWYFIDGPPIFDTVEAEEALANLPFSTAQDLATVGPKLTVPFTGVYLPAMAWYINNTSGGAQANLRVGLKINAAAMDNAPTASGLISSPVAGAFMTVGVPPGRPLALTAADAIKLQYASLANVAASFGLRRLAISPIYVT